MKKLSIFVIVGLLLFAFTSVASADGGYGCPYCCAVTITGKTLSCGGFYLPYPMVQLNGKLAKAFYFGRDQYGNPYSWPTVVIGSSTGEFSFYGQPTLGNYPGNDLSAIAEIQMGPTTWVTYKGLSSPFDVNCAAIGSWLSVYRLIPMWIK